MHARIAVLVVAGLFGAVLVGACGGASGNPLQGAPDATAGGKGGTCVPGEQVSCACPGVVSGGAQACNASGTGFGPCVGCALPDGAPVGLDGSPPMGSGDDGGVTEAGDGGIVIVPGYDGGVVGVACSPGETTTITGTVYDPAGTNPLYGVSVFVPGGPLPALPTGATCSCDGIYPANPIAIATTDAAGKFTLTNVPNQTAVPLVLQIGKWRTQLAPAISPCAANALPDRSLTLPRSHTAGDIPQIAISTGSADSLECLLLRVGLDPAEYVGGAGGAGHIHIFQGGEAGTGIFGTSAAPNTDPPGPASYESLWDSQADLMSYDMVFLSCEGAETTSMNQDALFDYAAAGGRVFASHYHYAWFNTGPFAVDDLATWSTGTNEIGNVNASIVTTLPGGAPFLKGEAMFSWLSGLAVLTAGALPVQYACENAEVTAANAPAQGWLTTSDDEAGIPATQYFSYDTTTLPDAGAPRQCGRIVYSDIHVGAASNDYGGNLGLTNEVVPTGCATGKLSPQEDALEFMLFDLSGCVTADK
jgi:hypothetical protein